MIARILLITALLGVLVLVACSTTTVYSMQQVAQHNSSLDCWSVVDGTVYDFTQWIDDHPGGSGSITRMCGIDATDSYMRVHGGEPGPDNALRQFRIGKLG